MLAKLRQDRNIPHLLSRKIDVMGNLSNRKNLKRIFFDEVGLSYKLLVILIIFLSSSSLSAQNSFITNLGTTSICTGESTTIQVIAKAGVGPYTIVYSDGSVNDTITNYSSSSDEGDYGGDPISVMPLVTTTYSLVAIIDSYSIPLPVSSETVTITVHPLPSSIAVTTNPSSPVCPGVNFEISATATNGDTYELWNEANTVKLNDLPLDTSITSTTNFTVRAISSFGCITTAPFTVELESTPPDITCPGNQTLFALAGSCEVSLPDYVDSAIVSDNCNLVNGITITQNPAAGTLIADHGTIQEVWLIATDEAGNSDSCAFYVTLNDTINPTINNLPGNISVNNDNNECGAVVTWVEPSSADNCSGHSISQTSGLSNNTLFPIGETTIIYTASDAAGNTSLDSFMVTVTDNEKPTISCPIDITQDTDVGECVANVTYTAPTGTDNCSGSNTIQTAGLASGSDFPIGVTTNTFLVTDAYGNSDSCSFTVTITDNEDPVIIDLPSDITVSAIDGGCDSIVTWNQPLFSDNCSGGSITQVAGLVSGSNFPIGSTWIKYEASDNVGNVVQDSFLVTVLDSEDPTISCPSDITSAAGLDSCSKTLVVPEITFDDNCTGSVLTWETTGSTVISGSGQPGTQTFNLGTTTVELTVTDASTNTKSCSLDVVINDEQVPSIVCPSTMAMDAALGLCTKRYNNPNHCF